MAWTRNRECVATNFRADKCNIIVDDFGNIKARKVLPFKFAVLKQQIFVFIHRISRLTRKFILQGSMHISGLWNTGTKPYFALPVWHTLHAPGSNTSRFTYARQGREIILNQ
jgi:hypothetical protein